jgi:hypothetical protein
MKLSHLTPESFIRDPGWSARHVKSQLESPCHPDIVS